jgi:hypothetical protein
VTEGLRKNLADIHRITRFSGYAEVKGAVKHYQTDDAIFVQFIGITNIRASSHEKPSHQILFACASKIVFLRQLNRFPLSTETICGS